LLNPSDQGFNVFMTAPIDDILRDLKQGRLTVQGEFLWGSNYTFLVQVEHEERQLAAVYKPSRGERPLWDFPPATLAHREVAAFLVSQALGWQLVPPTVHRKKGPAGPGSLQLFIEHDPEYHYFNFKEIDRQRLPRVALFDLLINNADRKGSHILIDPDDHLWLIDHGICFHVEDKLRTVIWDFAGQSLPEDLCADLSQFVQALQTKSTLVEELQEHLSQEETKAMLQRAEILLAQGRFPSPHSSRRFQPWPPL
jgi:uncharacterized repeat protein (TIGR03843 family)